MGQFTVAENLTAETKLENNDFDYIEQVTDRSQYVDSLSDTLNHILYCLYNQKPLD